MHDLGSTGVVKPDNCSFEKPFFSVDSYVFHSWLCGVSLIQIDACDHKTNSQHCCFCFFAASFFRFPTLLVLQNKCRHFYCIWSLFLVLGRLFSEIYFNLFQICNHFIKRPFEISSLNLKKQVNCKDQWKNYLNFKFSKRFLNGKLFCKYVATIWLLSSVRILYLMIWITWCKASVNKLSAQFASAWAGNKTQNKFHVQPCHFHCFSEFK